MQRIAGAAEGNRNSILYWGSHRLRELAERGLIGRQTAMALAREAAQSASLPPRESELTIRSAFDGGRAHG